MSKSDTTINLDAALVKAQAEMPVVEFDATNPFLKNKYASLGAVIRAIRPVLAKHGLGFVQFPVSDAVGGVGVESTVIHSSGEWRSERFYLPAGKETGKSSAQVAGSIVSYLRRYALAAMFSLYADEDTDGGKGNSGAQQAQPVSAFSFDDAILLGVDANKEAEMALREDGVGTLARIEMLRRVPTDASASAVATVFGDSVKLFYKDYDALRALAGLTRGEKDKEYNELANDLFGHKASTIGELLWMWRIMSHMANGSTREYLVNWYRALNTQTSTDGD
jgi:hypothetical protein